MAKPVSKFKMTLAADDESRGVQLISLVANPAVKSGWVALSDVTPPAPRPAFRIALAATEQMKQVVTGPVLIPDLDILRLDADGDPFYITFDADTIEATAARFLKLGLTTAASEAHAVDADGKSIQLSGPAVRESWIVTDPATDGRGFDVPAGTWMLSMHVPNADVWQKIVDGELTGFSLEGLFDMQTALAAVPAVTPVPMKKGLLARLAAFFALAAATLEDGTEIEITDAGEVFTLDANGVQGPALADGEYTLTGGAKLTVKDGKKVMPDAAPPVSDTTVTADTKMSAQEPAKAAEPTAVKLESIAMADGSTLNFNPITRLLTNSTGNVVMTGVYACADGSYFKVSTDQYTYQIDAATYADATKLSAVEVKLSDSAAQLAAKDAEIVKLKAQLAEVPSGQPVKLGAEGGSPNPAPTGAPKSSPVNIALSRTEELRRRNGADA